MSTGSSCDVDHRSRAVWPVLLTELCDAAAGEARNVGAQPVRKSSGSAQLSDADLSKGKFQGCSMLYFVSGLVMDSSPFQGLLFTAGVTAGPERSAACDFDHVSDPIDIHCIHAADALRPQNCGVTVGRGICWHVALVLVPEHPTTDLS